MKLLKIWLDNIQLFSITNYTIARNSGYVHEIAPQKKNALPPPPPHVKENQKEKRKTQSQELTMNPARRPPARNNHFYTIRISTIEIAARRPNHFLSGDS